MKEKFSHEEYIKYSKEIKEMHNRLVSISVEVGCKLGKSRTRKVWNHIKEANRRLVEVDWELETIALEDEEV